MAQKDIVIARIKALYPSVNLSKARINAIADKIEKRVNDDSDEAAIDTEVALYNDYNDIAAIAKADDRERQKNPAPAPVNTQAPIPSTQSDDGKDDAEQEAPAWAKTLFNEVANLKADKQATQRRNALNEALKNTSESFKAATSKGFDRMAFKDDDDFNQYIADLKDDAAKQSATGFTPIGNTKGGNNTAEATEDEIKEALKAVNI